MRTLLTILMSLTLTAAAVAQSRHGGGHSHGVVYYGGDSYPYGRYYNAPYYYAPYYYTPRYYTPYYYGRYAYGRPYGYYAPPVPPVAIAIRPGVIVGGGWRTFGPR